MQIKILNKKIEFIEGIFHLISLAILISLLMIVLSACDSQENKVEEPEAPKPESIKPESIQNLTAEIIPKPSANLYNVVLTWRRDNAPGMWLIHRRHAEESLSLTQLAALESSNSTYLDAGAQPGETYTYFLGGNFESRYKVLGKVTVTIPKDLQVNSTIKATKITEINRLFLSDGTKVVTDGKDLNINVNEIIANASSIETFPDNATASEGTTGRSGGTITLIAKKGTGLLHIFARGENGGNGKSGLQGKPGRNGEKGSDGVCGYHGDEEYCTKVTREWLQNAKKAAPELGPEGINLIHMLNRFYCKIQPIHGGNGERGYDGGRGGTGGDGGHSGRVYVEISDPTQIEIKVHSIAGHGGEAGLGGLAGAGGARGEAGALDHLDLCTPASRGEAGFSGSQGIMGEKGEEGKVRPTCLKLSKTILGGCNSF